MSKSVHFKSLFDEDFTLKCHFTILQSICTHKTYSNKPRITHSVNCPWNCSAGAKHQCGNMASKARDVQIPELCSKCRPYTLGTDKKLRDIQMLDDSTVEENMTANIEESSGVDEPTTKHSETRAIFEVAVLKYAEKNGARIKEELGKTNKPKNENGEQKTEKRVSTVKESSNPSLENGLGLKSRSWIRGVCSMFAPDLITGAEKFETAEVIDTDISGCEPENWQEVEENPDWDIVNQKEVRRDEKRKLWRESKDTDEEWINVYRT